MKKVLFSLTTLFLLLEAEENTNKDLIGISGEFRTGAVKITNGGTSTKTLATGGHLSIATKAHDQLKAKATLYSTNVLFGIDEEALFLDSNSKSYAIFGEAYIEGKYPDNVLRIGRQLVDTPYADADDIGMIPNTFEAIHLKNENIPDTTLQFLVLDKWSGVDSPKAEAFTSLQTSNKPVYTLGASYEGFKDMSVDLWHYKLDGLNYNYLESSYQNIWLNLAFQYTDQDNNNEAYGVNAEVTHKDVTLKSAYNCVNGIVSNGFGGGPFFTSSEDHTIADLQDQKATLVGADYQIGKMALGILHVGFDKGENETDYLLHYALNDKFTLDIIHANMYKDGKMTRVFANYNF